MVEEATAEDLILDQAPMIAIVVVVETEATAIAATETAKARKTEKKERRRRAARSTKKKEEDLLQDQTHDASSSLSCQFPNKYYFPYNLIHTVLINELHRMKSFILS